MTSLEYKTTVGLAYQSYEVPTTDAILEQLRSDYRHIQTHLDAQMNFLTLIPLLDVNRYLRKHGLPLLTPVQQERLGIAEHGEKRTSIARTEFARSVTMLGLGISLQNIEFGMAYAQFIEEEELHRETQNNGITLYEDLTAEEWNERGKKENMSRG